MQVMPPTGRELNVGNISQIEPNIHAGVKYMRFMMDQYFKGEPMDDLNKALVTFASYNAGPGRVKQQRIGRETVTYVSNIYKYFIAYRLMAAARDRRNAAKAAVGTP